MERERSTLEYILVVLLVDKVTLGKSQKKDIGEELVAHFLRGRDGQVVHLLNHTVEQIGSPALSASISSQAALLTETDPVRLPNVSATWLGRRGGGTGAMQGTQICKDVSPQRLARQHFSSLIDLGCNSLLVYLPCHSRISLTVSSIQL